MCNMCNWFKKLFGKCKKDESQEGAKQTQSGDASQSSEQTPEENQ